MNSQNNNRITRTIIVSIARLVTSAIIAVAALAGLAASPAASATYIKVDVTPAGDVVVSGTAGRDSVQIQQSGGNIRFNYGQGGTQVPAEDLRRDLIIDLGDGGDELTITNISTPRDLKIDLGNGQNYYNGRDLTVDRNYTITDGDGNTSLSTTGSTIGRTTTIQTGSGNGSVSSADNDWKGNYVLRTSATGGVKVRAERDLFHRNYRLQSGSGADDVELKAFSTFLGTVTIDLRSGNDRLILGDRAQFPNRVTAKLGDGDDYLGVNNVALGHAYNFDLGAGSDLAGLSNLELSRPGVINGGRDFDTVGISNVTPGVRITVRSVEGGYGF